MSITQWDFFNCFFLWISGKAITSHYANSAHKVGIIGYWNDTALGRHCPWHYDKKCIPFERDATLTVLNTNISLHFAIFFKSPVALARKFCSAIDKDFRIWLLMKMIQISPCHLSEMSYLSYRKMLLLSTESCSDRQNETQINAFMLKCFLMYLC